jgi:hypothetical protein
MRLHQHKPVGEERTQLGRHIEPVLGVESLVVVTAEWHAGERVLRTEVVEWEEPHHSGP